MRGKTLIALIFATSLTLGTGGVAQAQNLFAPAVSIDETVVTHYEIDQRLKMMQLFRTPGASQATARDALIEDRLKMAEMRRAGLNMPDESLQQAMEDFASRANLSLEEFTQVLNSSGIDQATLRDFVIVGVSWRDFIRSRYGNRAQISEAEVDAAMGAAGGSGSAIEVLLSEIIIAAPPPRAQAAMATAQRISQLTSTGAFEAAARQHSALPSKGQGGRLPWLPIANYPAGLRALLLDLAPGEITDPLPITNGVALFQMRDIREVAQDIPPSAAVEYAAFYIPGGLTDAGLRAARQIDNRVDTCDDLYGEARGLPEERLDRSSLPPADIPQDVALELAKLDPGETSYVLTRAEGETLVFLMLCGRTPSLDTEVDRDAVRSQLRSRRLAGYADAHLADLRASAVIRDLN